ncbi:hypothetical protein WICMUC_000953 [Wickerhamomyces mucosus]|uniref:Rgp1-domain-containing protein n=1 Tax=Wickerhamomyces mucosus TaxID=1378264 RepID=A0A9P8PW85_9ASCO|nr:hypothetical protein WICMUC_000953 [Wickerhamomyces mucosus]
MSHLVHSNIIQEDLRAEVVYESSPSFSDEDVSAIIRFRHLGNPKSKDISIADDTQTIPKDQTTNSWFGKRLSMQLSNTARSLFLEELESSEPKTQKHNESAQLISGYAQLSGWFEYDSEVINEEKIQNFKEKTKISGKFGGLNGLEISRPSNHSIYNYITSGIGDLLNSNIGDLNSKNFQSDIKTTTENIVPFFSSSQTLLFSSLEIESGDLKQFFYNIKLPKYLPSTYEGNSISIHYNLIVGFYLEDNTINNPKLITLQFPLRINSLFDKDGFQPISKLDQFYLLQTNTVVNEITNTKERRRSSLINFKKHMLNGDEITKEFKTSEILKKIDGLINLDEKDLNHDYMNDIDNLLGFDSRKAIEWFVEKTTTLNKLGDLTPKIIDGFTFEHQVKKLQTKYNIAKANIPITYIEFSKPFYKIGEIIKVSLNFSLESFKPLGLLITLENLELIRDVYSADIESTSKSPRGISHYKKNLSVFQNDTLRIEIPLPNHATHQFKNNLFENKWCLSLKFVLFNKEDNMNDESYMQEIFKDEVGKFSSSRENLVGSEFNFKIPLQVIPPDQEYCII